MGVIIMNNDELKNIVKMLANHSHAASIVIDYDDLVNKGILNLVGKSYYVDRLDSLPIGIRGRVVSYSKGKYGMKVVFSKDSKAMKKLADEYKPFRD